MAGHMIDGFRQSKPATLSRRGFLRALGITATTVIFAPKSIVTPDEACTEMPFVGDAMWVYWDLREIYGRSRLRCGSELWRLPKEFAIGFRMKTKGEGVEFKAMPLSQPIRNDTLEA